jgi:hypothetical protein
MKRFAIASFCTLAFVACVTAPVQEQSGSGSTASSAQPDTTVTGRLMLLSIPDGWDRYVQASNIVKFAAPKDYGSRDNDDSNDDAFYVFTVDGDCDQAYAHGQVEMEWGRAIPAQYEPKPYVLDDMGVGYQWLAFDGVHGGATEPGWIHRCINVARPGLDIDIGAMTSDAQMNEFIEGTFIPEWLEQASAI